MKGRRYYEKIKSYIVIFSIIVILIDIPFLIHFSKKRENQTSITVYVTFSGDCYHRRDCQYLHSSKTQMNLARAARNHSPCSICNPPSYRVSYYTPSLESYVAFIIIPVCVILADIIIVPDISKKIDKLLEGETKAREAEEAERKRIEAKIAEEKRRELQRQVEERKARLRDDFKEEYGDSLSLRDLAGVPMNYRTSSGILPVNVYVTRNGKCYHRPECKMAYGSYPMPILKASIGHSPCSFCCPENAPSWLIRYEKIKKEAKEADISLLP